MENSQSLLSRQSAEDSHNLRDDGAPGSSNPHRKCRLAVCNCNIHGEELYCSAYCEQAEEQGIEKDFCQCAHSNCIVHTHNARPAVVLPDSIVFALGRVTIECHSIEDLRDQVTLLAEYLEDDNEATQRIVEGQPGSLRGASHQSKAQSA